MNTEAHTALAAMRGTLQGNNVDNLAKRAAVSGPGCSEAVRNQNWIEDQLYCAAELVPLVHIKRDKRPIVI